MGSRRLPSDRRASRCPAAHAARGQAVTRPFPRTEEELRKLREETNAETLRQELDRERQRRLELEQKVQEVLKAR